MVAKQSVYRITVSRVFRGTGLRERSSTRLFSGLFFGVGPWDLSTFCGAGAVLAAVLLTAGWTPARHAIAIEPLLALRVI